jgi:flotillin
MQNLLLVALAGLAAALILIAIIVSRIIYICPPNAVLIFSGAHRRIAGDPRVIGYRVVQGGRGLKIPLIEVVDRMDLTNMIIELRVQGAYSRGGIPLNVQGVANVKVSSKVVQLANAIERFLGMTREQIMAVARETLEGNLRGVLSTLTPEEVNQDREKFAGELLHEADHDLARLGLELDTLKVQHVSDDKGYLDSIGRKQTAELLKRSRIAEADNHALSAENAASNFENQEIAKLDAEIAMARAEGARRIAEAQTRKGALIAESKGQVQAQVAKARAELDVQHARLAQVRFQLIADKVKPAEADKAKLIATARGVASKITEDGKATAVAIRSLGATWAKAGDSARQIFVAQKLSRLVETMMSTVGQLPVDKLTVIDRELAANGSNLAVKAAITSEQLKQLLGVDLVAGLGGALQGLAAPRPAAAALPPVIPSPPPGQPPPLPRTRPVTQAGPGKPPGQGT